jgi:hypothetical protein
MHRMQGDLCLSTSGINNRHMTSAFIGKDGVRGRGKVVIHLKVFSHSVG